MKTINLTICFFALILVACNIGPDPINYGEDACDFCRMSIVDQQHAAQIVTKKGKAHKYDAIECMLNDHQRNQESKVALYLVTDYSLPGTLIDAQQATYLISESIPSPMGEYLSAFGASADAKETKTLHSGETYSWSQLKELFKD